MMKSILGSGLINNIAKSSLNKSVLRPSYTPIRFNSNNANLDQLKSIFNQSNEKSTTTNDSQTKSTLNIDDLLSNSILETRERPQSNSFGVYDKFGFEQTRQPTPREVAKNIREFGVNAGRTVDVSYNNISRSFAQVKRVVNDNKIRYLQRIQSRFIRPTKYRKQLKREWWRRRFSQGFKELLHDVNDARRRGY